MSEIVEQLDDLNEPAAQILHGVEIPPTQKFPCEQAWHEVFVDAEQPATTNQPDAHTEQA